MYCPPESGIIAPSSAYANAPKNEMTPAITQTTRIIMGEGSSRAIVPGTMKIPTPMVVPITIQVESSRFSSRGRSAGLLERPGFICPFIGLHRAACQDAGKGETMKTAIREATRSHHFVGGGLNLKCLLD